MASTPTRDQDETGTSGEPVEPSREKSRIHVSDLMGDSREVYLIFNDSEYRLRVTNNNKLILTK